MKICRYKLILGFSVPFLLLVLLLGLLGKHAKAADILIKEWPFDNTEGSYRGVSAGYLNQFTTNGTTTNISKVVMTSAIGASGSTALFAQIWQDTGAASVSVGTSSIVTMSGTGSAEWTFNFETPATVSASTTYYVRIKSTTTDYALGLDAATETLYNFDPGGVEGGDIVSIGTYKPAALKIYTSTTDITGQIYWAGVGTQYGLLGGNWNIPFYWNICSSYNDINEAWVELCRDSDTCDSVAATSVIDNKTTFTGPQQCSGISYIKGPIGDTTGTDGIAYLKMTLAPPDAGEYVTATSSNFTYVINSTGSSQNYLESGIVSPLYVSYTDLATTSSTTIAFNYDLSGLDWENGQVCVWNNTSQTITDYCTNIATATGAGTIQVPNTPSDFNLDGAFVYVLNGNVIIKSNNFQIIFNITTGNYPLNQWLGTSNHDYVCSDEEWATPDPVIGIDWLSATTSLPALNFTKIKCSILLTGLNLGDALAAVPKNFVNSILDTLKTMFPFNVFVNINQSWKDSATATLPSELSWVSDEVDSDGNIYLDTSVLGGTATNTVIFGKKTMSENVTTEIWRLRIRSLLFWVIWGLFIVGNIYFRAHRVNKGLEEL